jgi:hypothetical protein
MASLGAFLLANWRWVLPLLAAFGLAIDDGLHRLWLADCERVRAEEVAAAEKARNAALAHAQALSDELIIAQAQAMATTEKIVTVYKDRIVHAPTTNSCGPSVRDSMRGVLDTLGSGGGQAPAQRSPSPAVRAPEGGR